MYIFVSKSERVRGSERVCVRASGCERECLGKMVPRWFAWACLPKIEGVDDPRVPSSTYGEARISKDTEMADARRDQWQTRWRPGSRPLEGQRSVAAMDRSRNDAKRT